MILSHLGGQSDSAIEFLVINTLYVSTDNIDKTPHSDSNIYTPITTTCDCE